VPAREQAAAYQQRASQARAELSRIEQMPVTDAATYIEQRNQAAAEAAERARREAAQREAQLRGSYDPFTRHDPEPPERRGPGLGL
jgi:hypothetical protein